jgi:hypothetical protein
LVKRILNTGVEVVFREWKKIPLTRGGGYKRRLQFVLLQARDQEFDGVVATVDSDRDKPKRRLGTLQSAREQDRQSIRVSPIPAALGEAVPHLEAWLLDDPKAIRTVLKIAGNKEIANVFQSSPKSTLNDLIGESNRTEELLTILTEIATAIDVSRCSHACDTGLEAFVQDIQSELGPIAMAEHE